MPSFFKTHDRACALILASTKGSRLFPMTTAETPKHLLPIAGIPCILRLLKNMANFNHVVVAIAAEDDATLKVVQSMATLKETDESAGIWRLEAKDRAQRISIVKLDEDCFGPVHAIRQVEETQLIHPSSRLVIFPGDLVFLQKDHDMSSLIRPEGDSSFVAMLVDVGEVDENGVPLKESAKAKKGGLARDEDDIEYIALSYPDSKASSSSTVVPLPRIVLKQSKLDVEEDVDMTGNTAKLEIPKARVRLGRLVVRTEWSDVHVYSLAPWVRKLIVTRPGLSSIQEDLLPLLVSRQFKGKGAAFGRSLEGNDQDEEAKENILSAIGDKKELFSVVADVQLAKTALRANTFPSYIFACKETVANGTILEMPPESKWNGKFQSLVLQGASLGSKITMRSSVIGKACQLGSKCRLNNVIVMEGAKIGENCSLQNTVIGPGAVLGNNCSLNDCQVGPGKQIPASTKEKGEAFMVGDVLTEEIL